MRRKALCSLMLLMTVASLVIGCGGGDSGPQSKPGEQPTSTETKEGKLKSGGGPKGK